MGCPCIVQGGLLGLFLCGRSLDFGFVVAVHLPAVEDILADGVYGGEDGGEGVEVFDGHPDAEGGVLLSEELSAGHLFTVAGADPFSEAEL